MTSQPEKASSRPEELQAPGYEIFIGLLAVLSLVNLAIVVLPWFSDGAKQIAAIVDIPLTAIFLLDFTKRLRASHPRRVYFIEQRGWLDLLGSLPAFFRLLRLFRLVRVWRLLQTYGARNIIHSIIRDRASNALRFVVVMVVVVLEFGSILVLHFESQDPNANIHTGGQALWWAFVSITTVGYGDYTPVTTAGRFCAVLVLAAGVGLFGVLSGFLANLFLAPAPEDATEEPLPEPDPSRSCHGRDSYRRAGDDAGRHRSQGGRHAGGPG